MCGIAGFCNWKGDIQKNIDAMNARMFHRGPDAGGSYLEPDGSVALGHRRLSIVDLSDSGTQPMLSHSGRFVMVFNGEIYNHKALRERLLSEGRVTGFRGSSDTEVLLEVLEQYGVKEGIRMCKGMFAIALYDRKLKQLHLLRDRVGEKPLYYGFAGKSFVFASEVGSIAALDGFSNEINKGVLPIYFIYGYIPAPYSIYENIYKLEPGTILTIKAPYDKVSVEPYWSMMEAAKKGEQAPFRGSEKEAAKELERLLKEAIKGQMAADVPVGAFLSSGIDSTTIVALMQAVSTKPVKSFTIGMEDPKYNEAKVAAQIAKHLGTEHTELYISEKDALEVIPKLSYIFGEPFADSSQIPTYLVSKMTREHVTVSLSGDGGDELFYGYNGYHSIERVWNKIKKIPYPARKLASSLVLHAPIKKDRVTIVKGERLGAKGPADLYRISAQEEPIARQICLEKESLPFQYTRYPEWYLKEMHHNMMLMDMLMYHPDDILVKVDRAGMAVSLESRIPMLDKDVVEFAWTLPIEYKYKNGVTKKVLRDVLYQYVPKELLDLPKKGFSIPIAKWLREPKLRGWAEMLIDRDTLKRQGILDPDVVWKIWNDYIERGQWRVQIWYILMFQEWICQTKWQ